MAVLDELATISRTVLVTSGILNVGTAFTVSSTDTGGTVADVGRLNVLFPNAIAVLPASSVTTLATVHELPEPRVIGWSVASVWPEITNCPAGKTAMT